MSKKLSFYLLWLLKKVVSLLFYYFYFRFYVFRNPCAQNFVPKFYRLVHQLKAHHISKNGDRLPPTFFKYFFCIFLHVIFLFFIFLKALRSKLRLKNLQPVRIAHGTCHIKKWRQAPSSFLRKNKK